MVVSGEAATCQTDQTDQNDHRRLSAGHVTASLTHARSLADAMAGQVVVLSLLFFKRHAIYIRLTHCKKNVLRADIAET